MVNPGVFSGLVLLVSLVSLTAAMLILLPLWKFISSVMPPIQFTFHCISRRQLVGFSVESGPGSITKSLAH